MPPEDAGTSHRRTSREKWQLDKDDPCVRWGGARTNGRAYATLAG